VGKPKDNVTYYGYVTVLRLCYRVTAMLRVTVLRYVYVFSELRKDANLKELIN
jgi:hypothetical protein